MQQKIQPSIISPPKPTEFRESSPPLTGIRRRRIRRRNFSSPENGLVRPVHRCQPCSPSTSSKPVVPTPRSHEDEERNTRKDMRLSCIAPRLQQLRADVDGGGRHPITVGYCFQI